MAGALALAASNLSAASGTQESIDRLQLASDTLTSMTGAADKGIPEEVLNSAKCIVVIPHLVKGGFVIGAEHGRGVATCRTSDGWSAPAFISLSGGSWGLQIGVEGVDLVMLVMNDHGLQHMLSSKFKIGADASASAGPVGRHASAGTDWKMESELLTYSRSKGLFAGISLDGAVLEQDKDSTRDIYGSDPSFHATLAGEVTPPESTMEFLKSVRHTAHVAAVADSR
jgi:lipid-binding SYLF domain-containing protein